MGEEDAGQGCAQTVASDPQGRVCAFLDELFADGSVDLADEELVEGARRIKSPFSISPPVLPEASCYLLLIAHNAFSRLQDTNSRDGNVCK